MTKTPYPALDLTTINDIDLSKLTIGYYKSFLNHQALDPSIKQATQNVLDTLAEKGATIKELDMFSGDLLVATYYTLALAETASELARIDGVKYGQRSEEAHTREEIYYKSRGE